jgi:hypothetical protein
MDQCLDYLFHFENVILVKARTSQDTDMSDNLLTRMFGWAVLNDTFW